MKRWYEYKDAFLDLIFPSDIYCICCSQPIYNQPYSICKDCMAKIKWVTLPACIQCGKPLSLNYLTHKCHDCIDTKHSFKQGFSCMVYDDRAKEMIYGLKFNEKAYYAKFFAQLIFEKIKNENLVFDYIIPVPLHKKREKERGYNQAKLIAEHLSALTQIPALFNVLIRTRYTLPQNQLSLRERNNNLKNAFQVTRPSVLLDKQILLIDDVYTTGSTVDTCSKELLINKASEVYVATCAIGEDF
ncbi:MAG: ComF family protein [Clostridia bacterium]|nr:ComF family protein [Clostridia bacterium]